MTCDHCEDNKNTIVAGVCFGWCGGAGIILGIKSISSM